MRKILVVPLIALAAWFVYDQGLPFAETTAEPQAVRVEAPVPQSVYVYISGAVRNPGLYSFPRAVRIGEALESAGGALAYADVGAVNYAEEVKDGMQIHVPYDLNGLPAVGSTDADGRININEADETKLAELPGIGPAMAKRIVEHRQEHGAFTSVEDLQKVKGIGPAKYGELKDKVTV